MLPIKDYFQKPSLALLGLVKKANFLFSDKTYLKLLFRLTTGQKLNLKHPSTFSEKLQWLKLHDRKPEYTTLVDKYAVKDYVANVIGKDCVIPTIGVWARPEDIEWDELPDKFVLKTTHGGGGGGVVICRDKARFDKVAAIDKLNRSLKGDIYRGLKEWPYKNVNKRIIAEQLLESVSENHDLPDYKFFCFNGEPRFCQVISGRSEKMSIDFYDMDWVHQPFHEPKDYPFADHQHEKPVHFEMMRCMARNLAVDKPFVRIDFYEMEEHPYFGEITFYPTSGMGGFSPMEYDAVVGSMLSLPEVDEKCAVNTFN